MSKNGTSSRTNLARITVSEEIVGKAIPVPQHLMPMVPTGMATGDGIVLNTKAFVAPTALRDYLAGVEQGIS